MKWRGAKIVVATRNAGKVREFAELLAPLGASVLSLNDFQKLPEIEETGETFHENAELKARTAARLLGHPVLADDSGLCVDALGGLPGVRSARYSGEGATDARNNEKLLRELLRLKSEQPGGAAGTPLSAPETKPGGPQLLSPARFVCVIAFHDPAADHTLFAEGQCAGWIASEPRGEHGFGYDPLFYLPELGCSMAELSQSEKNKISHRGKALVHLLSRLHTESTSI